MPWTQLRIDTTAHQSESMSERLEAMGAVSVCLQAADQQALFDHDPDSSSLWDHTQVIGLFDSGADIQPVIAALQQDNPTDSPLHIEINQLPDQDWERSWMDRFQPMHFGNDLWICPSWQEPPEPAAVNIILDPGMAFGTGTHPTTAMCMQWLAEQPVMGYERVIDYGCGSGILAVAAARLGAKKVWAVDIEEQALLATRENAVNNAVNDVIVTSLPGQVQLPVANLLMANILAGPLASLASQFAERVEVGGDIVLSGILAEQAEQTLDAYSPWFDMQGTVQKEEWLMLSGRRRETQPC